MANEDPDHVEDQETHDYSVTDFEKPGRKTKISEYSERYVKQRIRKVLAKETTVFGQDLANHLEFEQMIKSPDDEDATKQKEMRQV